MIYLEDNIHNRLGRFFADLDQLVAFGREFPQQPANLWAGWETLPTTTQNLYIQKLQETMHGVPPEFKSILINLFP